MCEGLINLKNPKSLNLNNVILTSILCDKCSYEPYILNTKFFENNSLIAQKNEEETELDLQNIRNDNNIYDRSEERIAYISVMHRLNKYNIKSWHDVVFAIRKIVENLFGNTYYNLILIGGDTCSDFKIFSLFLKTLKDFFGKNNNKKIFFLLGNHELWDFPDLSFNEVVNKYENEISQNGMYLVQNNIFYITDRRGVDCIKTKELLSCSKDELRARLKSARIILFGGLAFSGYNKEYNANVGLYGNTINRSKEIAETQLFEKLYNIICNTLYDKKVIIFTHTPQKDWCSDNDVHSQFVYVSGHTHRNYYFDDGEHRIYADNQIGYKGKSFALKNFFLDCNYDIFCDYEDGIYEITKEQYKQFYRGKNIQMTFNREVNVIYMLKRNGYYCFIHKTTDGQLAILNGGSLKKLSINDINYYYSKMDSQIAFIKKPYDQFLSIQTKISNVIKMIGGTGNIHGAIVDIDFYNHVYLNPLDLTVAGYWASDMIYKVVYSNIPALLKEKCPLLYDNYIKLNSSNEKNALAAEKNTILQVKDESQLYLNTEMYRASREIKKMQRLTSNILTVWYDFEHEALQ